MVRTVSKQNFVALRHKLDYIYYLKSNLEFQLTALQL